MDEFAELSKAVTAAANVIYTRWFRYVEKDDVTQHIWVWLAANKKAATEAEPADLARMLRNAGERYCRKEKAARSGYSADDECFYSVKQLERIVWDAFDTTATPPGEPYRDDEKYSEWVTEVAEVRAAVGKPGFAKKHVQALWEYVNAGRGRDDGVNDALWELRRQLGGGRPQ